MADRQVRGWTVLNGGGHALSVFARTRREAIIEATKPIHVTWTRMRRKYGCRVVKATLTYEAPDGR